MFNFEIVFKINLWLFHTLDYNKLSPRLIFDIKENVNAYVCGILALHLLRSDVLKKVTLMFFLYSGLGLCRIQKLISNSFLQNGFANSVIEAKILSTRLLI